MNMSGPPGLRGLALVFGICLVAGLIAGVATGLLDQVEGWIGTALTALTITVTMGLALWATLNWWRRSDEAVREAHKWAWLWGGSGGMAAGMILLMTAFIRLPDDALPAWSTAEALQNGAMIVILAQLAGYCLAWAAWWLRHR